MLPAMSTCAITQPPKMVPCALVSAGMGTMRRTGCSPSGNVVVIGWTGMDSNGRLNSTPDRTGSRRKRRGMRIALQHSDARIDPAMLRVLLVDNTPERASALKDALGAMEDVVVACTLDSAFELLRHVAEHTPDVILIDTESP